MSRKVLITGFTKTQCDPDYNKTKLKVVASEYCLNAALRDMGYEVDHRPVRPGEDLDGYERVVVYVFPPRAFNTHNMYGALWALHCRPDAIVGVNDWQISNIFESLRDSTRNMGQYWKGFIKDRNHFFDEAYAMRDVIEASVHRFVPEKLQNVVLATALKNGDHTLLGLPSDRTVVYDPTAYTVRYTRDEGSPFADSERAMKWLCPSLSDKSSWLKSQPITWPLEEIGVQKKKQRRVVERDMCMEMERIWGVLSPPHYHAGSGWWRARWHQAADAGCICVSSPEEAAPLGPAHVKATVEYVEGLSEEDLFELWEEQAHDMTTANQTKDEVKATLARLF